jgi:hypothetical protein
VPRRRRSLVAVGALFAFMGFDELLMFHEDLERWTGIDWQTLYLPVFALAGAAWLGVLTMLPRERPALGIWMWTVAAAAWVVAGLLEHLEFDAHDHPVAGAGAMDSAEKVFQFTGGWLFFLTMLLVSEGHRRAAPATVRPPSPRAAEGHG